MNQPLHTQAETLLQRTPDLPSELRQRHLAEAGQSAPDLLVLVHSLLARIDTLDQLVATPLARFVPPSALPAAVSVPEAGAMLGNWRLLRELGRDEANVLFLAERGEGALRQSGNLKLARAGAACAVTLARFERERQVLSRLDHPDIARMVDAGDSDDGWPFFVMEQPEGVPLDQYCATQQLNLHQRTALFARVCHAVHFAHQLLLLHHDLTPANIVVGADGAPKLLGFGIGGGALCPPAPLFASPEQLAGQPLGIGADLYALGAILYALLSGRAANAHLTEEDASAGPAGPARRDDATHEPAALALPSDVVRSAGANGRLPVPGLFPDALLRPGRTLARQLRGDLDQILMTAVAPDTSQRYPSADAFARHLQRYAQKLPLDAAAPPPPSPRRPLRVAIAIGIALLASALMLWKAGQSTFARVAEERRVESGRALLRAMVFDVSDALDMGPAAARAKLVNAALAYLSAFSNDDGAPPQLRRDVASTYQRIGEITGKPQYLQEAFRLRALEAGVATPVVGGAVVALAPAPVNAAATLELLSRRTVSAARAYARGQPRATLVGDALQKFSQLQREFDRLLARDPANAEALLAYVPVLAQLVELKHVSGDLAGARQTAQQLIALTNTELQAHPGELRWRRQLSATERELGDIMVEQGQNAEGVALLRQALDSREKIAAADVENELVQRDVADVHKSLAGALLVSMKYKEAEQDLALARATYSQQSRANQADTALRAAWIELELARANVQYLQLHGRAAATTLDLLHSLGRDLAGSGAEAHLATRIDLLDAQIQPRGMPSKAMAYAGALHAITELVKHTEPDLLNASLLRETAQAWQTIGEIGLRAGQTEAACAFLDLAARRYQQFEASNRLNVIDKTQWDQVRERRKACS